MQTTTINKPSGSHSKSKAVLITLHIAIWSILFIVPHIIINLYWSDDNFFPISFYINAILYSIIFYINYLWLVPKFFLLNKKVIYFTSAALVIVVMYFINYNFEIKLKPHKETQTPIAFKMQKPDRHPIDKPGPPPGMDNRYDSIFARQPHMDKFIGESVPFERKGPPVEQIQLYFFSLISVIITGFSVGLKVIDKHSASEKRQRELEKEKLNSELAFLKNQISPHFFFNTLNNIYSLVEINKTDAQDAILKLSKLMRYLLYESEVEETYLSNEIDFMQHYIKLMQLRISSKVDIDIQMPDENTELKIPPLLFIPFIENAFKHGVSYREKSFIKIDMKLEHHKVYFSCCNSISTPSNSFENKKHSGIGLTNVRKRLQLLFPERHQLNANAENNIFCIELELDLKQPE